MALGQKRICYSCGAKFYDLDQEPAKCPKCGTENYLDGDPHTKRGRKQLAEAVDDDRLDDIEVEINDMEDIEELEHDDDEVVDLDSDIRDKMSVKDEDEEARERSAPGDVFEDVDGDTDDIIDSSDVDDEGDD